MKHIQTRYLWAQEKIALKLIALGKIGSKDNHSDVVTKSLSSSEIKRHLAGMGQEFREGHAAAARRVLTGGNGDEDDQRNGIGGRCG